MIRIGITGQAGFMGTHLFNTLVLYPTGIAGYLSIPATSITESTLPKGEVKVAVAEDHTSYDTHRMDMEGMKGQF